MVNCLDNARKEPRIETTRSRYEKPEAAVHAIHRAISWPVIVETRIKPRRACDFPTRFPSFAQLPEETRLLTAAIKLRLPPYYIAHQARRNTPSSSPTILRLSVKRGSARINLYMT